MTREPTLRLASIALAALLAAAPAWAQESGDTAGGDAAAAEQPATEPAAEPAVPAEDALGQSYIKDVSGDWQILCIRTELEADPCRLHQLLKDANGNNVATFEVVDLSAQPGAAGVTIVTPLDTLLTEQVTVSIDGSAGQKLPFEFCTPRGCVVRLAFGAEDIGAFKRGNKAQLTIVPAAARDQKVDLAVSLIGFTAGLDKVAEFNALAEAALQKAQAEGGN